MVTEEKGLNTQVALPATFEELNSMAKAFVASGMFQDTRQLSQAIVKIQAGRELGLPPVYSMQNINLIRGRLTTSANTMAMLVKKSGKYNYRIGSHSDTECKIEFLENGKTAGWSTFTIEDAQRADLIKPESGWMKYPRAMLFSRAISQGARLYCPDAIGGVYTDEEIRSIPPRTDDGITIGEIDEGVTLEQAEAPTSTSEKSTPVALKPESKATTPPTATVKPPVARSGGEPVVQQGSPQVESRILKNWDVFLASVKKLNWEEGIRDFIYREFDQAGEGDLKELVSQLSLEQQNQLGLEVKERLTELSNK